ncbi:MAG: CbiX/SirB N-terminal domain-containing protein [Chloroflexota bacterium]
MRTALILAGHGSHILPKTAGVVWGYVDALRELGVADEITATFWKEQPEFSQVLKTIQADMVVIVPLFTASGYYVNKVIPTEMNLNGAITERDGRTFHLTASLGEYPAIAGVVQKRVIDALREANLSASETAVAIIGHGTPRSNTTQLTTKAQVQAITDLNIVSHVLDAYLDDDPNIPSIYERTDASNLIIVPFFLAQGSHVAIDVPEALGVTYGDYPAQVNGRTIYYTPPIGTDDVIIRFILEMVAPFGLEPSVEKATTLSHFPRVGHEQFTSELEREEIFHFGGLTVSIDSVYPLDITFGKTTSYVPRLRQMIRENPFRPWASSSDLPTDWVMSISDISHVPAVIETIYPSAIADWAALQHGTFETESFDTVIRRQQGMFKSLANIDDATLTHFVSGVCGRCIKHPAWHQNDIPEDTIPCPAPCNYLLSKLKENTQ